MPKSRLASVLSGSIKPGSPSSKRVVKKFADDNGLVYFGYVSQRNDEYHIVRGMTVSTKHRDDHYCIGTYEDYDVVFVERTDSLKNGKKHRWYIMEFDLKTKSDIPHTFIASNRDSSGFGELLSLKYPAIHRVNLGMTAEFPQEFTKTFGLYCRPVHAATIERVITPKVSQTIGSHFDGLIVEITKESLFLYSEQAHPSQALLTAMLKNGAWLAAHIDENSRHL